GDFELFLVTDRAAVAGLKLMTVQCDCPSKHLHPCRPSISQLMRNRLAGVQCCQIDAGILIEAKRFVGAVGSSHESQQSGFLFLSEDALLVTRFDALVIRQEPNLVEMHPLGLRRVELAVADACSRAHALQFPGLDY